MPDKPAIVYCRCKHSSEVPPEVAEGVLSALAESDVAFEAVPDLCELAARRDPALARWARTEGLKLVACHKRAAKWLFHAGGAELSEDRAELLDMKSQSTAEIAEALLGDASEEATP